MGAEALCHNCLQVAEKCQLRAVMAEGKIRGLPFRGRSGIPLLASAKKQGRSLASSLSFIQCAHGFGEVQHEAEGQAGEAVYDEEGSDAHGLGGHAADRDADRSGEPHGGR